MFALDEKELGQYGVVLEAHLERVTTFSVGQVRVGGRLASYYGTQRLTRDNAGNEVYGGSDLVVVDGDFEALLALDLPETTRLAVSQAQVYDEAASSCYRHFRLAAQLRHRPGHRRAWPTTFRRTRAVLAHRRCQQRRDRRARSIQAGQWVRAVKASSIELYGEQQQVPAGAQVLYRDEDAEVGFITKCVMVEDYGDA